MTRPRAGSPAALASLLALAVLLLAAPGAGTARAQSEPPDLRARSAILVEPTTGDVILERDAAGRRPIASTTKLMTALLTLERASLDDVMRAADYDAAPVESQLGLRPGERLTVRDLLRGLMLESANDAAVTLAEGIAGSRGAFVEAMNDRARELGLRDTSYANPIGLDDPDNYSSARDLAALAIRLREETFARRTMNLPSATLRSGVRRRTVANRNRLVRQVAFVNGVKTGRTQGAGYVLVGSGTRDGVTVVSAVLGEPSEAARDEDTLALLRHGLSRYERMTAVRRGRPLATVGVRYRDDELRAVAYRTVRRTVRRGERVNVAVEGVPDAVEGPVARGDRLGTVLVRQRGRVVGRVPLVADRAVAAPTLGERVGDVATRPSTLALLILLAACSLPLVLLRRRAARRREAAERRRRPQPLQGDKPVA